MTKKYEDYEFPKKVNSPGAKTLYWVLAILAVLIILVGFMAPASANEMYRQTMEPLFKINNNCSAVVVKSEPANKEEPDKIETLVLTASHCLSNSEGFMDATIWDGGKKVKVVSFMYDRVTKNDNLDLGLFRLRDRTEVFPVATIAKKRVVDFGDTVYATGFPQSLERHITIGAFNKEFDMSKYTSSSRPDPVYLTSVPVVGGSSGGGLFQKVGNNYELIGITSRGSRSFEHLSLFSTLDNIQLFVKYYKIGE